MTVSSALPSFVNDALADLNGSDVSSPLVSPFQLPPTNWKFSLHSPPVPATVKSTASPTFTFGDEKLRPVIFPFPSAAMTHTCEEGLIPSQLSSGCPSRVPCASLTLMSAGEWGFWKVTSKETSKL